MITTVFPGLAQFLVVSSDVTTTSTTAVDVTGLAFQMYGGARYGIYMALKTNVNSGTAGMKIGFAGPASITRMHFRCQGSTTTSLSTTTSEDVTSLTTTTNNWNAFAGDGFFSCLGGSFVNGANDGVFKVQFLKNTSQTAKIYAGSFLIYAQYT